MNSFVKGQEVVIGHRDRIRGRMTMRPIKATVVSVGRRWVNVLTEHGGKDRFDPEEMETGGGDYGTSSPVFLSLEAAADAAAAEETWEAIRQAVRERYHPPEGVSAAQLAAVLEIILGRGPA